MNMDIAMVADETVGGGDAGLGPDGMWRGLRCDANELLCVLIHC
jgi:hypothetical protein